MLSFPNLSFDSVQWNRKDAVTALRVVQGGLLATASRKPRAHGELLGAQHCRKDMAYSDMQHDTCD